ncbi:hypothetical protein FOL46_000391 [Perkinsus olseni]|uniref:Uncharacterized protein n=1 Tax=Perkinsus olseni TaxID=32597 RepID=A0A7J6KW25_PEROL|nr:hypothetical protein FOL46_000391 [Perkinsus olseni]
MCLNSTVVDVEKRRSLEGNFNMVGLVDASPSEANLRALSNHKEGRMYEVPTSDCKGGCGCRTDSQIVLYGEHGEVSAAVCAQICNTTDDCPPPQEAWDGVLGCAPFGRCYLKCGSQWSCLTGGSCISVPAFEDKACMYWLHYFQPAQLVSRPTNVSSVELNAGGAPGGGSYRKPLDHRKDGCECNTEEYIIGYNDKHEIAYGVCADACAIASECDSFGTATVACKLSHCYIKCRWSHVHCTYLQNCLSGGICADLPAFEDGACMSEL